jgi:hypothetical protein
MNTQLTGPLPGFRLWAVIVQLQVRGAPCFTRSICFLEEVSEYAVGALVVLVRHAVLNWEDLAAVPGLPRSFGREGQQALDIALEHILAGNARAGFGLPEPRQH